MFEKYLKQNNEIGEVVKTAGSVVEIEGLPGIRTGEMVFFESGQAGYASAIKSNSAEIIILSQKLVEVGARVSRSDTDLSIPVGDHLLGKTIGVLSEEAVRGEKITRRVDVTPSGISNRKKIERQLETGVAIIDLMLPMGMGQRELIMGDRKTGKSYLLWQIIMNQVRKGNICIYAAIGKKRTDVLKVEEFLAKHQLVKNTVVVQTSSEAAAGEIFICPYTAMAIAEYFRDCGQDVLVVMDDITTHAKFYREMSLLSKKFPGRDSYPGDTFHMHSRLMERAGNFLVEVKDQGQKEVAITCLPVVETIQGDITGYIQTNVMSMTDGHIFFDNDLFVKGRRPAIDPFVSVTRVGRQTQSQLAHDASRALYDVLNAYEKTQGFLRFGAELGENSRQVLAMGEKILNYFEQPEYLVVPENVQLVTLQLLLSGLWNGGGLAVLAKKYIDDENFRNKIDDLVKNANKLADIDIQVGTKIITEVMG